MTQDKIYSSLKSRLKENPDLNQELGVIEPYYLRLGALLARHPWRVLIPLSLGLALFLWLILRSKIIYPVSVLQEGF